MFGIGMTELMVILVIGLVVLGPKRLPELARSLGRSMAEFRRASNDMRREFMSLGDEMNLDPRALEPRPPQRPAAPADPGPDAAASSGSDEAPGPARNG